jgi:phosphoglycerate dehydrogenase-like enzyme
MSSISTSTTSPRSSATLRVRKKPRPPGVPKDDGSLVFAPVGLDTLDHAPRGDWEFLAEDVRELTPQPLGDYDGLFHFSPAVTAASLKGIERLAIIARHGVGLDNIDLDACTEHGVAVTITPDAIRRPMASAALALILALAHRRVARNAAFHAGRWHEGRFGVMGFGLTGRTLGVVGFGNIGREIVRLAAPCGMRMLVTTPHLTKEDQQSHGVEPVDLQTLLSE